MKRDPASWAKRRAEVRIAAERLPKISQIPRVANPTPQAFRAAAGIGAPFVISCVVGKWKLSDMSPADLVSDYASVPVRVRNGDYVSAAFSSNRTFADIPLSTYFELAASNDSQLPPYAGNVQVPQIAELCEWPPYFPTDQQPRVWLGPAGTVTPLHCDYLDNLFAQVWGRKQFRLFSPGDFDFLPTREVNPTLFASPFDPEQPDYIAWPTAQQCHQVVCLIEPGELLFLPAGWFHHVRAVTFSLSLNRWTDNRPLATVDPPVPHALGQT